MKMMLNDTAALLINQSTEIDELIKLSYTDPTGNCEPIYDGIVKIENYIQSEYKILWILKEPYDIVDNGYPEGGGWSFSKDFLSGEGFYGRIKQSFNTWHPIIYTTYGILNNFIQWDDMDYITNNKSMADSVQNIAVINVKKLPGLTTTPNFNLIKQAYEKHNTILHRQIEAYNPDVIIGASTLFLFYDKLGIDQSLDIKKFGSVEYAEKGGKLFISAYHPAQRIIEKQVYVDDIINCVKEWQMRKSL